MKRVWGAQPLSVYRVNRHWEWHCRLPYCVESGWSTTRQDAQALGLAHLCRHNFIGFRGGGRGCSGSCARRA